MCEYCGCQNNEVIAELTEEHDVLRGLGRELMAAADANDVSTARSVAIQMRIILRPHAEVEEGGLFPALQQDFSAQMQRLISDHVTLDATLGTLCQLHEYGPDVGASIPWQQIARAGVAELFEHILKEQDGVFPAALATLTAGDWDGVADARRTAHGHAGTSLRPL